MGKFNFDMGRVDMWGKEEVEKESYGMEDESIFGIVFCGRSRILRNLCLEFI